MANIKPLFKASARYCRYWLRRIVCFTNILLQHYIRLNKSSLFLSGKNYQLFFHRGATSNSRSTNTGLASVASLAPSYEYISCRLRQAMSFFYDAIVALIRMSALLAILDFIMRHFGAYRQASMKLQIYRIIMTHSYM